MVYRERTVDDRVERLLSAMGGVVLEGPRANLLRLRDGRIDLERMGQPRFLAVVTGTEHGHTLHSGVHVVPLATLTA